MTPQTMRIVDAEADQAENHSEAAAADHEDHAVGSSKRRDTRLFDCPDLLDTAIKDISTLRGQLFMT